MLSAASFPPLSLTSSTASICEPCLHNDRAASGSTLAFSNCTFHVGKFYRSCLCTNTTAVSTSISSDGASARQCNLEFCASEVRWPSQNQQPYIRRLSAINGVCKRHIVTLASTAGGSSGNPANLDAEFFQETSSLWGMVPKPLRKFPWDKAGVRLVQRIADLFGKFGKWFAIPLLGLSALSEILYAFLVKKELLIPFGLLAGIIIAGIMKEISLEMSQDLKDAGIPWHLIVMGVFFTLVKLPGPSYPDWACIFLLHFANGGLLQTILFARDWRKSQSEIASMEEIGTQVGKI